MLIPCDSGPNGQEQCGIGSRLLAFGCLDGEDVQVELQASESILGSWVSGVAQRSSKAASE